MGVKLKYIAIICNYELLEDRVGGMDYFFWAFNDNFLIWRDVMVEYGVVGLSAGCFWWVLALG